MRLPQPVFVVGLITCVSGALVSETGLLDATWHHVLEIIFVAGTAASAFMLKPPVEPWDGTDRRR